MEPFKSTMSRKSVFLIHCPTMTRKFPSRILLGGHKTLTLRLVTFSQLSIQRVKSKTGTLLQESVSVRWRTKPLTLIHNFTVLTLIMMEPNYLLRVVSPYWDSTIKSKEKSNLNLKNPTLPIIVIQIEFFVQSSTEIPNFNILFTVVDGIQLLLHGIWELENQFKMYMDHLLVEMVSQIAEWIF